jgi:hypothetical protein
MSTTELSDADKSAICWDKSAFGGDAGRRRFAAGVGAQADTRVRGVAGRGGGGGARGTRI